jgi:hypothetical protein
MRPEPYLYDSIAPHTRVHTARNGFYLRQLRHAFILGSPLADLPGSPALFRNYSAFDSCRSFGSRILLASKLTIRQTPRASRTYTRVYR